MYNNWRLPTADEVALEYKLEVINKGMQNSGSALKSFEDFSKAVAEASVVEIDEKTDSKIAYRSHTRSRSQLVSLLKSYRSWPEFRNEKTVERLYNGFDQNDQMPMPFVLKWKNGNMRVLGGNTRMDVAFQKGCNPKVLMINVD